MRSSEAEDGSVALQNLSEAAGDGDPFQVALIDMCMPGMDGETLGRASDPMANCLEPGR